MAFLRHLRSDSLSALGGFTPVIDSTGKITGYKTKVGADTVFPFRPDGGEVLFIGGESTYVGDAINPKTFSTVKCIDDSAVELINDNKGLRMKKDLKLVVMLKVNNTRASSGQPLSAFFVNGTQILTVRCSTGSDSYAVSQLTISVSKNDILTIGALNINGYETTQLLIAVAQDNMFLFNSSTAFNGIE